MNLAALRFIVENNPERIQEYVPANLNPDDTIGVARDVLGRDGNIEALTTNQRYHFNHFILPLIENVACEGVFSDDTEDGQDGCIGSGLIDDGDLEGCYLLDEMLCQECQQAQNRMDEP